MKMKIIEEPLWLRITIGLVLGIAAGVVLSPDVGLISVERLTADSGIMDRWLGKSEQEAGETEGETGDLSPSASA